MMKNAFYFMLKALLVLKIYAFLFWLFNNVGKSLDEKVKFNFRIYDVPDWIKNNYNTHTAQYLQEMKFGQLMDYNLRNVS